MGTGVSAADTLGKTEPHHEYIDFCSFAASGLDMDSDVDMSNNIGHIITSLSSLHSLGSQLGRGAEPSSQDAGFSGDLRQWPLEEKRTCDPVWGREMQQQGGFATSDGYASSPDHYSDSGAELLDTDSDPRTPPQPQQPGCLPLPPPPPPAATQLRPRFSSQEEEEDVLMALQPLSGIAGAHGHSQTQELDIEKLVTDYLGGPEDMSQQHARLDELAAALARASGTPAPVAIPVSVPAPVPVSVAPSVVTNRRPMVPATATERPAARWAGPEGGSSILEGVLRGTLAPVARVTSPPNKPVQHCFPAGGFHGYPAGGEVRAHGLSPVTSGYPCDGSSAGSPGRIDCALSPVAASPELFAGGPLTSPQPQPKKDSSRKRKYAKRGAVEGDVPPSRGRLLHFCPICSKGFKDKYSVNVHIRTHTGEKPFQCELCNKCFRQKAHLAKHVHIHSSPKTPPAKR